MATRLFKRGAPPSSMKKCLLTFLMPNFYPTGGNNKNYTRSTMFCIRRIHVYVVVTCWAGALVQIMLNTKLHNACAHQCVCAWKWFASGRPECTIFHLICISCPEWSENTPMCGFLSSLAAGPTHSTTLLFLKPTFILRVAFQNAQHPSQPMQFTMHPSNIYIHLSTFAQTFSRVGCGAGKAEATFLLNLPNDLLWAWSRNIQNPFVSLCLAS